MGESKIAVKGKANKGVADKTAKPEKAVTSTVIETNGLILTLDNSIKKYANDPFFVKKTEEANQRFAQDKKGS